jgi:hypothetical protein
MCRHGGVRTCDILNDYENTTIFLGKTGVSLVSYNHPLACYATSSRDLSGTKPDHTRL